MAVLKVPVSSHDHIQGKHEAPVVLVEYGDYQCPYCGQAYPIIKQVQEHFGDRLAFVFRNFPLKEIHPFAESAAEAAEFAAAHGKFWEMHDAIFENQDSLQIPMLLDLAQQIGLPVRAAEKAITYGEYEDRIKQDFLGGVRSGVNGTPTLFINGHRHDAELDFDSLVEAIEAPL